MGRRKIEIKAIKDDRNRSVLVTPVPVSPQRRQPQADSHSTFLKRKGGLFKKAHELAVLCSVDVAVIIFGHNKKLYEYSSCDMHETLGRYQYFGPPHEHKGPEDFNGRRDDDDDEDETTPAPEELQAHQNPPSMVPPHIPTHPGFQHINHAPSASPPIANGLPFDPRRGTPQPQGLSRPSSRNHIRRVSSNLGPQHHATPPPPQNGFAYMPNPSAYNPNMQRPGQFQHLNIPPGHHQPPGPQHHMPAHTMPPQPMAQTHMHPPHAMTHPPPQMGHPSMPQVTPAYLQEQGRSSMPPAFADQQQNRTVPLPETSGAEMSGPMKTEGSQSPPQHLQHHHRSLSSKSRSIFTPIDDRGSVLARHFGVGPPISESPRPVEAVKAEESQEGQNDEKATSQPAAPPPKPAPELQRTQSVPSVPEIKPPLRTNSGPLSKRPQLKVQIPSEASDGASATADSSSSAVDKALTPAKANADTNHSGVVLPPPSPSAGAILSAGAQGPPNPFARPPPPATAAQNNNAYNANNNIETPISALPSRFVSDALLPSPSSFFPEWGFGRSGPDTNMLPSPLTFPTPAVQSGPGFAREDEQDKKRKSPDSGPTSEGATKKTKT